MLRALFIRFRYLLILASLLVAVGIIVPLTGFAKLATSSQPNPTWTASGNILLSRFSFRATTLPNGQVLIEGGFATGSYTTDSELFNPATGVWTETGSLNQGRGEHSATLLQNGQVLVAGGYAGPVLNSAELYNSATGTWTLTGSMSQVRTRHTATLLPNGKVLVAGGWDGDMISSAELYDPTTGSWSSAGNMAITRADHVAVLLPNGQVLVAGGAPTNGGFTTEAELYNPNTNTWTLTGSMNIARINFTAVLLSNGKVLAIGGDTPTGTTATAELYDPTTGTWTLTGNMQEGRMLALGMQALLLADGTVLVVGGDTAGTSEVYNPSTGTWGSLTNMVMPQCDAATALLPDGLALIAGGDDCTSTDDKLVASEVYTTSQTIRQVNSTNWAGYALESTAFHPQFMDITASWTVPKAHCGFGETSASSISVALGSLQPAPAPLEQIGTLSGCALGIPVYFAVYQMLPAQKHMTPITLLISAGDPITAEVKFTAPSSFTLSISDAAPSRSWSYSKTLTQAQMTGALSTALWAVEAPSPRLTNFGTVNVSGCLADGMSISHGTTIDQFTLVSSNRTPRATSSSLNPDGMSFSVQWQNR